MISCEGLFQQSFAIKYPIQQIITVNHRYPYNTKKMQRITPDENEELIQARTKQGSETNGESLLLQQQQARKKKIIKWAIIGGVGVIVLTLAIVLPIVLTHHGDEPKPTPPLPYYNPYNLDAKDVQQFPARITGLIKAPSDYHPESHQVAFQALMSKLKDDHPLKKGVNSQKIPMGMNSRFTRTLNFTFAQTQWRVSHLTITDNDNKRFSVPDWVVNNPADNLDMRLDMTGFDMNKDGTFGFSFSDPLTGNNYVNMKNCSLVFADKFIQMDLNLPSQRLFGFGERIHEFALGEGAWNMWAQGQPNPYDDGSGRKGEYGVHPFLLVQGKQKDDFFGLYFRNANAMTPIVTFNDDGTSKLTFITIGGQIEIFFFIHGSAQDVIKRYQDFLGAKPKLPPFWALGWMQASYKWFVQKQVEDVIAEYRKQNFPLDVVFLDIPYMDNYVDFTVNKTAFPDLPGMVDDLHAHNQHLIPIIDAAISAEDLENKYYKLGDAKDVFIKSTVFKNETLHNNLINQVWPKIAVFVDWFNPNCTDMWWTGLNDLYKETKYDGIWIDMNEPWGFQTAEIDPADPHFVPVSGPAPRQHHPRFLESTVSVADDKNTTWYKTFPQDKDSTWFIPFTADFENYQSYDNNTISLNATNPSMNTTQYNLHDFYGHMMARRTSEYFAKNLTADDPRKDKRNFILTRSTFTGTGQYASHWLGDNYREYRYMNYSISGTMNMNMFGIPHVGADIGGFFGATRNDKLSAKWAQLATFYPFARFHYDINSAENEPFRFDEPYRSIVKQTMYDRYQYSRLLYTCLFEMSKWGGTCFDPLFYYFPTDEQTYNNIEHSFIFAGAIKVTPSLTDTDDKTAPSYFPAGNWVNLNNLKDITNSTGATINLDITSPHVNTHFMPGKIIPFQNNSDMSVNSIHQLINRPISLLINRDDAGLAKGSLFLDQGESLSELKNWQYEYYTLVYSAKTIQVQLAEGNRNSQNGYNLAEIKILNALDLNETFQACYLSVQNNLQPVGLEVTWVPEEQALRVTTGENQVHFSDIHSIHLAASGELNVCSPEHFRYRIVNNVVPPLKGKSSVSFDLVHVGNVLPDITATLRVLQGGILNLKWTWKDGSATGKKPYVVPDEYISTEDKPTVGDLEQLVIVSANPFAVKFMWDAQSEIECFGLDALLFEDYLNWVRTHAVTESGDKFKGIFGLGERADFDFFYKDGVYSMWSRDVPTPIDFGGQPGSNMYGTHPYYMFKHAPGKWVGVLHKLAAAQDWWIKNDKNNGRVDVQTVAVGGVGDIYVLPGATPDQVTQKYYTLIGNPVLIPQWALGWNQCRYGYRSVDVLRSVVAGYKNGDFPLDVIWSDIDYMQNYRNFLYDSELAFKDLPAFINDVHKDNLKWVPILDAGTAARPLAKDNYEEFLDGDKRGVFMKINDGENFIGQVWPNDAVYPDFFFADGAKWWQDNLSQMHNKIPFDGLWLDMNEVSNFCVGACYQRQIAKKSVKNKLRYIPTGRDLEVQSMPIDSYQVDGNITLDTHSLYGIQEVKVTHEWFRDTRKVRTFIIERSSFAGMGKYGSRWLGDNFSQDKFMQLSVSGVMQMSMFGIPLSGSDICGFMENTNETQCTKWHFVGAFYPFSRNHNGGQVAQEPYVWSETAQGHMRDAIKLKYSLVRYYYTGLFDITTKGSGTFYKPMFFEFPDDEKTYVNISSNVMIGSALKLSINSDNQTRELSDFYFPAGLWCQLRGTAKENCFSSKNGVIKEYPSAAPDYQLHIREGFIVPMQDTSVKKFSTTKDLQNWPVEFNVLGSLTDGKKWIAQGRYINDDGENLNLVGTVNSYSIYATYDGASEITVLIGNDTYASEVQTDNGCFAVNKNDYMSGMSFHNAKEFGLDQEFTVTVTFKDATSKAFTATYEDSGDRLFFAAKDGEEVCMTRIQMIKIKKN